jgi:hypothetical protein
VLFGFAIVAVGVTLFIDDCCVEPPTKGLGVGPEPVNVLLPDDDEPPPPPPPPDGLPPEYTGATDIPPPLLELPPDDDEPPPPVNGFGVGLEPLKPPLPDELLPLEELDDELDDEDELLPEDEEPDEELPLLELPELLLPLPHVEGFHQAILSIDCFCLYTLYFKIK